MVREMFYFKSANGTLIIHNKQEARRRKQERTVWYVYHAFEFVKDIVKKVFPKR